MALINQDVPEKEKTKDWVIGVGRHILASVDVTFWEWQKDELCWSIYNGQQDENYFDYLRKVGDYEYPAKIRFFPVVRPFIDNLQSEHSLRPFNYIVYAFDNKSVEKKSSKKGQFYLDSIINSVMDYRGQLKGAEQQAQTILQQIEQMLNPQQQAENQAQGVQPVQQPSPIQAPNQQQVQMMNQQKQEFEKQLYILNQKFMMSEEDIKKIEVKYKMNDRELHEIIVQKALEYMEYNAKIDRMFNNGFLSKNITDKAIYFNDWDGKKPDPEVRKVNEKYFYYSYDNSIDFVHEAEWTIEDQYLSVANIIDQFRFELTEEDMSYLNAKRATIGFAESENRAPYAIYNQNTGNALYPMNTGSATCRLSRIFFKSPRRTFWKDTPNKYMPGTRKSLLIDENEIPSKEKRKPEDNFETYYLNDIYEMYFIDGKIPVRARKKPVQNRSVDQYGNVPLPYSGIAWRSMNRQSSSPVYQTKDIQILYNIVHYHKELWLALSGAKGLIMDLSQKPEGMSMEEWTYQRKMGTGWIQSVNKKGRQNTFNQFKTYDDSLGSGYSLLLETLDHLEKLCGKVIGMPPQRLGQIAPTDQVGTTEQSVNQSNMTTEIRFKEHEVVKGLVMEQLANLCRIAWKDGKRGSYILGDQQMLLDIPSQVLGDQMFRLFVKHSGKEIRSLQNIQQQVGNAVMAGKFPISQLAKVYSIENLTELEKTLEVMEGKANEMQQKMFEAEANAKGQGAAQQEQAKAEIQMQLMQLQQEFEGKIKQGDQQIGMVANQIKEATLEWQKQKDMMDAQIKAGAVQVQGDKASVDGANEANKIESTRQTELAYLEQAERFHKDEVEQEDKRINIEEKTAVMKAKADVEIKHMKASLDMAMKREGSNRKVKDNP